MTEYLKLCILTAKNNKDMADAILKAERFRKFRYMARDV